MTASVDRTVELYGPRDVVGIDPRAVIAYEPRAGAANFESNYMPYVAFYDEDFPWRYTPVAPEGDRLVPWISLVVLRDEDEFEDVPGGADRRASIVVLDPAATLPPTDQLHLWAHVHVNDRLAAPVVSADGAALA